MNQATCSEAYNYYECVCKPGYKGRQCETGIWQINICNKTVF